MNNKKTLLTASFLLLLASCSSQKNQSPPAETVALGEENQEQVQEKVLMTKADLEQEFQPIFFRFDSSQLTYDGQRKVQEMSEAIKNAKFDAQIIIGGHTDPVGTKPYNYALGRDRALTVRNHLVELGVEPSQLKIVSYGEATVLNSGKESHDQLRRVELGFTGPVFEPEIQQIGYSK